MQSAYAWETAEPASRSPWAAGAGPRRDAADILALLWRERVLMLAVFLVIVAVGVLAALQLKPVFTARSSLLINLGQAYVYNPRVGDAARGAVPEIDDVIQSEVEILSSDELKLRVIHDIGLARIYPKLGAAYARASPAAQHLVEGAAVKAIQTNLKIITAPQTAVVRLAFSHADPRTAALVLNTLIDEYLRYRNQVLISRDAGAIGDERRAFQQRLDAADAAYEAFLRQNNIGDFESEKASLGQIYSQLLTDDYSVQAQLSEVEGRLGVTSHEVATSPSEIGLYQDIDHTAADKLLTMKLDRQDLLSRYKPDAQPVQDLDRRIGELEALSAAGQSVGAGARRVGVNPVYQTLLTEREQLEAQAASLRDRRAAIAAQIAQLTARRQRLAELEPQYDDLVRQRDVLSTNVRNFAAREEESQAQQAISQKGDDNVHVVERAYVPAIGTSLRRPVMILAVVFGLFAALCAGLLRAFLDKGFPTRAAAERAFELPVLATARMKTA